MIPLLVAALLADQTVILKPKARPAEGPSLVERAGRVLRKLIEKPEPHVADGNARAAHGDVEGALDEYDKARLPETGARAGALAHNRASALLRAGDAKLAPRAIQEANRALTEGDASLKATAAYDLGYALEQAGKPDEAIAAYARALQLDPEDRDAKVNLELLLRDDQRKQKQPQSTGQPEKEKKPAGKEGEQKQAGAEERQKDQQKQAGKDQKDNAAGQEQQAQEQPQPDKAAQPRPDKAGEKKDLQAAANRPMDRSEAERLLDALRAGEKNLQVWRFGKQKAKERRTDVDKDW